MKNVYVTFESGTSWIAKAIQWFTKSKVNHVSIEFESDDWDDNCVLEAVPKGVVVTPKRHRTWFKKYKVKSNTIQQDVKDGSKYIGEKYDFAGFFLFGWFLLLWRVLKLKIRHPLTKTKGQFCSELVARILGEVLVPNPQWKTPQDILNLCEKNRNIFELN